jgi:hypothetical protein
VRRFSLGAVLSVISGRLLCELDELYQVLNFLTGQSIYTHQIPRAFRVCAPYVATQHPDLAVLDWSGVNNRTYRAWMDEQVRRFGATAGLEPLPAGAYDAMHPLDELIEMRGGDS